MAEAAPLSFIFGGNTGTPTYQELLRRRAIATAQAGRQRKMPTTLGEGMTYLGEAVGDRMESNRLSEAERAFGAAEDKRLADPLREPSRYGPAAAAPAPVLDAGSPIPSAGRDRIAAADIANRYGAPQEVASLDPTLGAATPPGSQSEEARWNARTGKSDDDPVWSARQAAIGGIESSDDYRAVGVQTKYGRALGRYGVMEVNVAPWTQAALGRPMTPQEFLADDKAQDIVFRHRFGQLVAKHGEEKAARAWYGGEGNINNLNAMDAHEKLTVRDYGQDYLRRLQGKRAEADGETGAPIQLAAGGGPAGTVSDAPPPGLGGGRMMPAPPPTGGLGGAPFGFGGVPVPPQAPPPPHRPGSEAPAENDPTVTEDIKPMSVTTQIAQAPAGMIPGSVAGVPGVAMGPNQPPLPAAPGAPAGAPAVPADLPPSLTPIPPASEQVMRDPGSEPKAPERLDFSPRQRAWMKVINNRNSSDHAKEYAKSEFNLEEKVRTEMSARQNEAYRDQRERWQKQRDEFDKFEREAPTRRIEQHIKRLQIEAGIAEAEKRPLDVAKLKNEIEIQKANLAKLGYEAGVQRTQEERQRALNITKTEQEIAVGKAPPHITNEGQLLIWDQDSKTFKARPPDAPGEGQPNIKLTEPQAKTFDNLQKAEIAYEQYKRVPDVDKVLGDGLRDELAGKIPFFGNAALSDRYRRARTAALNIASAHLRETSGAAIGVAEEAKTIAQMFPMYGDDPGTMKNKRAIVDGVVTGMKYKLGPAGVLSDYARRKREETDVAEQAKIAEEMKDVRAPVIGKVYKQGNKRRYWTGSRWEDD